MQSSQNDAKEEYVRTYLRFAVPLEQVNSRTLGVTLVETENLLKSVAHQVNPELDVDVRVRAFQRGSFEIPIDVYGVCHSALLAVQPLLPDLQSTIKTMAEFIKLKRLLGGKQPKNVVYEGNRVEITGDNNKVIIVDKVTMNVKQKEPAAHRAIESQFTQLERDEKIEGFEVLSDAQEPLVSISRSEFPPLIRLEEDSDISHEDTEETREALLVITGPILLAKVGFWNFLDESGRKLSAKMTHANFLQKVGSGETFAAGDRMKVDLRIRKTYDRKLGTYKVKSTEITRVIDHYRLDQQTDFRFKD